MKFISTRITGRPEGGKWWWKTFREQILSILPQLQVLDGEMLMHHEEDIDDDDKSDVEEDMEGHDADGETDEQEADVSGELIDDY